MMSQQSALAASRTRIGWHDLRRAQGGGVVRTCHPLVIRRTVGVTLLSVMVAAITMHGGPNAARWGTFSPDCARLDLRAFSVIQERGEAAEPPVEWLANAGLGYLQARMHCLGGDESKGAALYQRIIDGDISLSSPGKR